MHGHPDKLRLGVSFRDKSPEPWRGSEPVPDEVGGRAPEILQLAFKSRQGAHQFEQSGGILTHKGTDGNGSR